MKYILVVLTAFSLIGMWACQKGDTYYYDYKKGEQLFEGSTYDYILTQKGNYDSLALVLERLPSLKQKLKTSDNNISLFAADNRSFALAITNLNIERRKNGLHPIFLEDVNIEVLDTLTHRYVFDALYPIKEFDTFLDGRSIFSTKYDYEMHALYKVLTSSGLVGGGQQQLMFSDVNESIYQRYWNSTNTTVVDFKTKSGIIHKLTSRHEFGFGKLTTYLATN